MTTTVLEALARKFPGDWGLLDSDGDAGTLVRASMAIADPSIGSPIEMNAGLKRSISRHPTLALRLIALHDAVHRAQEQLRELDDRVEFDVGERRRLPWEEARDWFHHKANYFDDIDKAAERIAESLKVASPIGTLINRLETHFGIRVVAKGQTERTLRAFDHKARVLRIDPSQPPETTAFSIAHRLALLEIPVIEEEALQADVSSDATRHLLRAGLANYAAGALLMPYGRFRAAAIEARHDVERLRLLFGTSFEQTCHRLSTLQRPGATGVPFFFCRVDMAGNITKRHSATRLQFARFGGGCPLWVVHEAVAIPDRVLVQLAETPDGVRYVAMAKGLVKPSGSYTRPPRRYAVALGCEADHASEFIYADSILLAGSATPIGVSCRICTRRDCEQRAFPPAAGDILIDPAERGIVPYDFRPTRAAQDPK